MNIVDLKINREEFETHFLAATNNVNQATKFWNTYNPNPKLLLETHQFLLLRDRLLGLLRACKSINPDAFAKIHKGHPYSFIGISSYLLDDYQTAIYFFDASVTEDINCGADPINNPKPSTRFLMLEGEQNYQAAKQLTKYAQTKVERALDHYQCEITKDKGSPQINIIDLRKEFIYSALTTKHKPGLPTLVTAFITYIIEWDFRNDHFELGVGEGTSEPFFLHLFRGCILFESLLKYNPKITPNGNTLNQMLNDKQIRGELKTKPVEGKGGGNIFVLDDVLNELQNYTSSISETIKITYIARNTLGHSLSWNNNISQKQYQELYFVIASSCLHVIACLWKS